MKKILLVVALLFVSQINVYAFQYIDETYTGNTAAQANDTGFGPSQYGFFFGGVLGGPVGNQYVVQKAAEFTVDQSALVNYLAVTALLVPYNNIYETARGEYVAQRRAQGATPEQIVLEINGDGVNPPSFAGPSQSINVNFALINGSELTPI